MKAALAEAHIAASKGEVPVGAVITANGRIIARGHNLTEKLTDVTAHAEIQAITAASNYLGSKYLQKCALCNTRAMPHVRWRYLLVTNGSCSFWCKRC